MYEVARPLSSFTFAPGLPDSLHSGEDEKRKKEEKFRLSKQKIAVCAKTSKEWGSVDSFAKFDFRLKLRHKLQDWLEITLKCQKIL